MPTLLSESGVHALLQETAVTLQRGVAADRAAVFYLDRHGELSLGGVSGLTSFPMDDCPFSVSILERVLRQNQTVLFSNVPRDAEAKDNVSLQLSGAVSLLCVPFYDETDKPAGVLYADTSGRHSAFHRQELLFARDCANWLECCLAGRDNLPKPEPEARPAPVASKPLGQPSKSPPSRPKRAGPADPSSLGKVSGEALLVFLRSLSTLTQAGIAIHTGLDLLCEGSQSKAMGAISRELADLVANGEPLSAAMERFPNVFTSPIRSAVRLGERSGSLVHVLDVLATDLEKSQRIAYRVRGALTYPAFLSVLCGLMLLFGPPYLLQGHLKMLADSKVPLPVLTQALVWLSELTRSPLFLVVLTAGIVAFVAWARSQAGKRQLLRWAFRLPVIGPLLGLFERTVFARSLSLQLRAGMTVMEALSLARQSAQQQALAEALHTAERALRDGATLADGLSQSGYFEPVFLSFVESGEATGELEAMTAWLADFYEREVEARLDSLVALVEPLIMAVMGAVAAVLMIATLKPTLLLLQAL